MWLLSVNWTGQAFDGEQMLALRDAAVKFVQSGKKGSTVEFRHEALEGVLTRGKEGRYGGFGGTFFHADCGLVRGERWTIDFLVPDYSMHIEIDDDSVVFMTSITKIPDRENMTVEKSEVIRSPGHARSKRTVH